MTEAHDWLDLTAEFFSERQMPFERNDAESYIESQVEGASTQWHCYAHTFADRNQLVCYSVCPTLVPDKRRAAVAEFACALNYQLAFGNLEMSAESGELRLRTVVEMAEGLLTDALIAPVIFNNIGIMDDLLPILLALIGGDLTPDAALEQTKRLMTA